MRGAYRKFGSILIIILLCLSANMAFSRNEGKKKGKFGESISVPNPSQIPWIDQMQLHTDTWAWYVNKYWEVAQSFVPSKDILSQVSLLLCRWGKPNYVFNVSIREELTGYDLTTAELIPPFGDKNYSWVTFDFPDIKVVPGKKYYIVCRASGGTPGDCYGWFYANDSSAYPEGETYGSGDHGKTWDEREGDCCFITYTSLKRTLQEDELDQYQNETGMGAVLCGWWDWAQSFVPSKEILTRVKVKIQKRGNIAGDVTVSIRKSLNGDDLTYAIKPTTSIPSSPQWIEFDFDNIYVEPGQTYYIVYSTEGGDNSNNYYSLLCSRGDTYPKGDAWIGWNYGSRWEKWEPVFDFCFQTYGMDDINPPEKPMKPFGPTYCKAGEKYGYITSSVDPEGSPVCYGWDWDGDGNVDEWTDYYTCGKNISTFHTWSKEGSYQIRVKAKDMSGKESEWSDPLPISVRIKYFNVIQWIIQIIKNGLKKFK